MENGILSLKSIYMVLMNEDFPNYSESVIARSDRKGLTMLRFWQRILVSEFRSLPCGQMLWRSDGKRNRYTSYLCNRSTEIKTYQAYAQELSSQICENSLKNQIAQFTEFLSIRKYRHDVLLQRIRDLIQLAHIEDPQVSDAIAGHILRSANWRPAVGEAILYQDAYLLTMLSLYAASGEAMDGPDMALLQAEEYGIQALWESRNRTKEKISNVSYLTVHSGILQDNPLPRHRFFGREEELFELKELAATGCKRLILGMGGLGKTELLRQLIRVCEEERIVDKIAVVPYEGDIVESFARSFPGFRRQDPEKSFHSVLHRLTKEGEQSKVLLLIDNLTNSPETDPELRKLLSLPCSILISARRNCIEEMEACILSQPSIGTGSLIFRDNYGRLLSPDDRKYLSQMLADEALCHPLTLRLMASAARNKGWSVQELKTHLEEKDALSWQENDRTVQLSQVYRRLYSYMQLPKEGRKLAELFTLLPRDSYTPEFLRDWFPASMGAEADEKLAALTQSGWLDQNETGFSMHPLIAQCLRRRVIQQSHLLSHMAQVVKRLNEMEWADAEQYGQEQSRRIGSILCHAVDFLSGSIGQELMCAFLRAGSLLMPYRQEKERFLMRAERMRKRCTETDDRVLVLYCTACGRFNEGEREQFLAVHDVQKRMRTVPERMYLDFCLAAGNSFACRQEYDIAQPFLNEVLAEGASCAQKAEAYCQLCECCEHSGSREESRSLALEGAEYVLAHPECGEEFQVKLMSLGCQLETVYGNQEGASKWLSRLKDITKNQVTQIAAAEYELTAGNYELNFGDLEKAYTHFKNVLALMDSHLEKDVTYYMLLGQIAIVLQRLKRYAEAVETYLELLAHAEETKDTHMISMFSNNLSVAYLELEQPRKALAHLEVTLEIVRPQGGIALAEAQRNRARAFGQLEDRRQEYACLLEASPLLDVSYGPDHPRSAAARQRLAELKEELRV